MRQIITGLAGVALAFAAADAAAQASRPAQEPRVLHRFVLGDAGVQQFEFLAAEPLEEERVVTGAPFSAEAVTEVTQTLADGNRIERRFSTSLWRDSQGRTRREQQIVLMGPLTTGGDAPRLVTISDPVAGTSFTLNEDTRTAHRQMRLTFAAAATRGSAVAEAGTKQVTVLAPRAPRPPLGAPPDGLSVEDVLITRQVVGPVPNQAVAGSFFEAAVPVSGAVGAGVSAVRLDSLMSGAPITTSVVTESLGTRMIEGVAAEGTRTTTTIPAGAIGNVAPIDTVTERWFSPELETAVLITRRDPRSGETTYRLTNLVRAEPPSDLFTIPADYQIIAPPPPPPPPPAPPAPPVQR